jgi:hypothetical protein
MKEILENICFCLGDDVMINSREYYEACKIENKLRKRLKPKDERLFFAYTEACVELSQQYKKEDFRRGFIAGCKFLLNIISKDESAL